MKFIQFFIIIFFVKSSISIPIKNFAKPAKFLPSINSVFSFKSEAIEVEEVTETPDEEESIWDKIVKDFGKLANGAADLANDFKEFSSVVMRK